MYCTCASMQTAKYLREWITHFMVFSANVNSSGSNWRKDTLPERSRISARNQSKCLFHTPTPSATRTARERGSTAFSCVEKKVWFGPNTYSNNCTTIKRQKFINLTLLPRVSTYNGILQGGGYQRKVLLRQTASEMCRYKTEIRVLNYMVKVKVNFTL
jgi:hypothetical protein